MACFFCRNVRRHVFAETSRIHVNFDKISSTQLALPAEMGGLGVSSASLLALPCTVPVLIMGHVLRRESTLKDTLRYIQTLPRIAEEKDLQTS